MTQAIGSSLAFDASRLPQSPSGASADALPLHPVAPTTQPNSPETRFPSGFDAEAPRIAFEQKGYDSNLGKAIAQDAQSEASRRGTVGNCYNAVADVIDRSVSKFLWGGHAYMSAPQFAARKDLFREMPANDLSKLPAGAVVVWGKGSSDSGHISIALGDGREASDHIAPQMQSHYGGAPARVFVPIK